MKLSNSKYGNSYLVTIILVGLTACSSEPQIVEYPDTASPTDELKALRTEIDTGIQKQVNVLSPHNFEMAENAMGDAQVSIDRKQSSKDALHHIAEGHLYMNRANTVAELAHAKMDDVTLARQDSINAKAPEYFPKEFRQADKHLKDVTSDLESGDLKSTAKKRSELQAEYLGLELKSIKVANLGSAKDTIQLAVKEGAPDYAPRSLAMANKAVDDADAFITANRHDTAALSTWSREAQNKADHLLSITRESKLSKKASPEEIALQIEAEKEKVMTKEMQLDTKQAQLENKQSELNKEKLNEKTLMDQKKKLEADEAFNRSFDEAQAEFSNSEAEVYKQGNTLLIRLKGLKFPSAKATLKNSDFALLSKVQKIISEFKKSSVVIEGHTDSIGGKALNEKLSSDRAEAVREYFLSSRAVDQMDIKAVGLGDQKPLASNKTSDGRAQNRRVDVLISPEKPE